MKIDPWANEGVQNYKEICDKFGLEIVDYTKLPNPTHLHRRGIIFAHRDLDNILEAKKAGRPFGVLSGLMPSGQIHLGHKMVIDQARWYQELGGDVTITVADLEAHATRGLSLEACRKYAIEEYVTNYAGMGLDTDKTSIYFQSERPIVQKLGFTLGKKTKLSEMEAIYGGNNPSSCTITSGSGRRYSASPNGRIWWIEAYCGPSWYRPGSPHPAYKRDGVKDKLVQRQYKQIRRYDHRVVNPGK